MSFSFNSLTLGPLFAFLSSCTWALGSARYSKLSEHTIPPAINGTRALLSLPFFILAILIGGYHFDHLNSHQLGLLALSIIASYGIGDLFFLLSTRLIGVPSALAIASSYPAFASMTGMILGKEIPQLFQILGSGLTILGIIFVILSSQKTQQKPLQKTQSSHQIAKGVILALLTSVFWSINSYCVSIVGKELNPFVSNVIRMSFAIIISAILSVLVYQQKPHLVSKNDLKKFWWVFIIESFGGSIFFVYGLSHSSLILGTTLTALAPILAVPIALLLGLEKFSLQKTLGVILAVCGILLLVSK
jgi:drug/metabolite transporter (DMT)-like permease